MWLLIFECLRLYLMISYLEDREIYSVGLILRVTILLILLRMNGFLGIIIIIIAYPMVARYIKMLEGISVAIFLNESFKKGFGIIVVVMIRSMGINVLWLMAFIVWIRGLFGAVVCRLYVYALLGVGIWVVLWGYVIFRYRLLEGYKIIVLRLLPMITFFVKVVRFNWIMWLVMLLGFYVIL